MPVSSHGGNHDVQTYERDSFDVEVAEDAKGK